MHPRKNGKKIYTWKKKERVRMVDSQTNREMVITINFYMKKAKRNKMYMMPECLSIFIHVYSAAAASKYQLVFPAHLSRARSLFLFWIICDSFVSKIYE